MNADLAPYGVSIVALSKDSVATAAAHRKRDGLALTLLADPELKIIRQYGVEHHKAVEFSTGSFMLFGIPLALFPSFKTMAIPTTLLVDEAGKIAWIDQSEDYRMRSEVAMVLDAVKTAFDPA